MVNVRVSRRASSLRSGDYDHEIILVDEDEEAARTASVEVPRLETSDTLTRLVSSRDGGTPDEEQPRDDELQQNAQSSRGKTRLRSGHAVPNRQPSPPRLPRPTIEIRAPTPQLIAEQAGEGPAYHVSPSPRRRKQKRETAIDILYENERGGFLCGVALFSGAALGGLDPTPWTNGFHKSSPTNIHNAQCPDPSWEWVWPEWRIYQQEGTEEDGWEYSFYFSKRFSWHRAKWYNSFVRRRAWIRRRAKRRPEDISSDYHVFNNDYFSVAAASDRDLISPGSATSSRHSFVRTSMAEAEEKPVIEDIDMLMHVLRLCRIDREKREAVENYLEHAIDLAALQHEMHEIMSLFVFQASRRQLLSRLMREYEETMDELARGETLELRVHGEALNAAIRHAEEEMCKLSYWSDLKQMAENGELPRPGEGEAAWQGLDKSSPGPPGHGENGQR